jgi:hypothetical protein
MAGLASVVKAQKLDMYVWVNGVPRPFDFAWLRLG